MTTLEVHTVMKKSAKIVVILMAKENSVKDQNESILNMHGKNSNM